MKAANKINSFLRRNPVMIYYVDQAARMEGCGTKERPFRHINDAGKVALPGY